MSNIVFRDNNLKQRQFINAVFECKHRVYVFGGAIRGGKTFVAIAILIMLCKIFPKSRWVIVRKNLKVLKENTRPTLNKFLDGSNWKISEGEQTFTAPNGSMIIFKGENYDKDKELNGFRGLECNGFVFEEVNECRQQTYLKGIERAGSYIIPGLAVEDQPPPLMLLTCNPSWGWVKELIYDPWKFDKLPPHIYYLPSYVTDNPNLPPAYLESLKNLPIFEYKVFVEGDWDVVLKRPNAFWHQFEVSKHLAPLDFDSSTSIHISIDANAMPYCAATIWQVYPDEKRVCQIHEITATPANEEQPNDENHAGGLAKLVIKYLESIGYDDVVFLYGDATTKSQNTIDEKKRSFFSIFNEELNEKFKVLERIGKSNPQIAITAEFTNALYAGWDGWQMSISEFCKTSINDYLSVSTAEDGTMAKIRVKDDNGNSFEQFGHISDTKRYFIYKCLESTFIKWKNRFSEAPTIEVIDFGFGSSFQE